jgi:thiosulfate reductase cytochrome b subunit
MTKEEHREIVEHLEKINHELHRQNSYRHMFGTGIVYGIGFFVGSAILATIALGLLSPWLGQIAWIRDAFTTGTTITR